MLLVARVAMKMRPLNIIKMQDQYHIMYFMSFWEYCMLNSNETISASWWSLNFFYQFPQLTEGTVRWLCWVDHLTSKQSHLAASQLQCCSVMCRAVIQMCQWSTSLVMDHVLSTGRKVISSCYSVSNRSFQVHEISAVARQHLMA